MYNCTSVQVHRCPWCAGGWELLLLLLLLCILNSGRGSKCSAALAAGLVVWLSAGVAVSRKAPGSQPDGPSRLAVGVHTKNAQYAKT